MFLIRERRIKGIRAFSNASFEAQLVPGIVAFRAVHQLNLLGWWSGISKEMLPTFIWELRCLGYELKASFSLMSVSIQHFSALGFRWLSLLLGAELERRATLPMG